VNWGIFTGDKKKKKVLNTYFPTRRAAKDEIMRLKTDIGIRIPLYSKRRRKR